MVDEVRMMVVGLAKEVKYWTATGFPADPRGLELSRFAKRMW
jgi:hypothetical protein